MTRSAPSRRHLAAVLAALSVTAVAGCGSDTGRGSPVPAAAAAESGTYPVTVQRCGRSHTYQQAPRRILLGWAPSIRTLDALGVADRAFGYLSGSLAPPPPGFPALRQVSPDFVAARETVIAARPDLVLVNDENQVAGEQGGPGYDDLAPLGAAAFVLGDYCQGKPAPTTIDAVYRDIRDLGAVMGVPDRARTLEADLRRRVTAAGARRGGSIPVGVALVQSYDGKLYALSGSYYSAILAAAGLRNEFADIKQNFAEISAEQVLTRRPAAVFAVHQGKETAQQAIAAARTALAGSPAVRDGAVHSLPGDEIAAGGVTVVDQVERAAAAVYGP